MRASFSKSNAPCLRDSKRPLRLFLSLLLELIFRVRFSQLTLDMLSITQIFKHFFFNSFPREDEGSPRQAILSKWCQDDVNQFRACMNANNYDENKCLPTKAILDKCASIAFKKVNDEPQWIFWALLLSLLQVLKATHKSVDRVCWWKNCYPCLLQMQREWFAPV